MLKKEKRKKNVQETLTLVYLLHISGNALFA
jgi:hypothetical protein